MSIRKANITKKKKRTNKKSSAAAKTFGVFFNAIVMLSVILGVFYYLYPEDVSKLTTKIMNSQNVGVQQPAKTETPVNIKENVIPEREPDLSEFKKYKFSYTETVKVSGTLSSLTRRIYIPQNEREKQYVKITSVSVKPQAEIREGLDKIYKYTLKDVSSQTVTTTVNGEVLVRGYDLKTAKRLNYNISPENDLSRYLKSEPKIESDDPYVLKIADKISGETREEILQNIYVFLQNNIKYTITPNLGAKGTLQKRIGKCTDYSAAMVALCRAKNIPARIVSGDVFDKTVGAHAWVEVYYDEYGWVTYDPTFQGVFVKKNVNGVVTTERRLDSTTLHFDYLLTAHNLLQKNVVSYNITPGTEGRAASSETFNYEVVEEETE